MSDPLRRLIADLPPDKRAALAALIGEQAEPIALVGMGCRFPGGAVDPTSYWRMLETGTNGVREVPSDRWDLSAYYDSDPKAPGKMYTRWGGFLDGVDGFDAGFFGISPREAARMDPQQRLFLEVVFEALEDAGHPAEQLAGRQVGVFAGVCASDYCLSQFTDPTLLDAYVATGNAHSIVANRVSYLLDLQGPSLAVDTACSSSLVAVHLACRSLQSRECNLAIAGGVQLILSPFATITFCKAQMMAPDGKCKTFDADADGFVRGEGAGAVVLKRLSDALAARDPIRAVIRSTAINQDGRSNGLMAPSGLSQQAVIREALARAGLTPRDLSYVEAHGTGTALGDPIEVEALAAVLGAPDGDSRPCALGAVKTNLGHLEGAAGVAGLIKTVLSLEHETIPQNLHFQRLNPHISLDGTRLVLPTSPLSWTSETGPRYAGVSSFGFGGTNAHVIVGEAPRVAVSAAAVSDRVELITLSARTPDALSEAAFRLRNAAAGAAAELRDLAHTANTRRTRHERRLAVVARTHAELIQRIDAFLDGRDHPDVEVAAAQRSRRAEVAFVFSGQGSQWIGMGRELLASEPVFRDAVQACDAALEGFSGLSIVEELARDEGASRLGETAIAQPAIFSLQVGLVALLRSWGVTPSAVVGHSVGEVAAALTAGVLSLDEAARLIYHRSRLMQQATGNGRMVAVELTAEDAERAIADERSRVAVAAVNGPLSAILSGEALAVEAITDRLRARGVGCRPLQVPYAFHSPQMAPFVDELREALRGLAPRAASIPFYSTVSGGRCDGPLDADYWVRNLREGVRFLDAVRALGGDEYGVLLEVGPQPDLCRHIEAAFVADQRKGAAIPTLRRSSGERWSLLRSVGALHVRGATVDLEAVSPAGRCVPLPSYPWQRQRHWARERDAEPQQPALSGTGSQSHPLLGRRVPSPLPQILFEAELAATQFADHRIAGKTVLPVSAAVETALAAAARLHPSVPWAVESVVAVDPCVIPDEQRLAVQCVVSPGPAGSSTFLLYSRPPDDDAPWSLHLSARLVAGVGAPADGARLDELRARLTIEAPALPGLIRLWVGDGEALAELRLPERAAPGCAIQPLLLEACAQTLGALAPADAPSVIASIERCQLGRAAADTLFCHARLRAGRVGDLRLLDGDGGLVAELRGVALRSLEPAELEQIRQASPADWLYEVKWKPSPTGRAPSGEGRVAWLLIGREGALLDALARRIGGAGEPCVVATTGAGFARLDETHYQIDATHPEDLETLVRQVFLERAMPRWRVVHLSGGESAIPADDDGQAVASVLSSSLGGALSLAQTLARRPNAGARLYLVTRGAQATAPEEPADPSQATLWGFASVLALEHPEVLGASIDLAATPSDDDAVRLFEAIRHPSGEDRLALRPRGRLVARLERSALRRGLPRPRPLSTDGIYLITGGLGGLGLAVARGLVARGARHLMLLGRSVPSAEAQRVIADLEAAGAQVRTRQVDVSDGGALARVLAEPDLPPLRGVVHSAGLIDDGIILRQSWEQFARVLAPKAIGAWHLHHLLGERPLDFFVLFSSAAAVLGSPGQANYAAANAFLGALAQARRHKGLPGVAIEWGPWADVGMAARTPRSRILDDAGTISPARGVELLFRLATAAVSPVVVPSDWSRLAAHLPAERRPPLLSSLISAAPAARPARPRGELLGRLKSTAADNHRDLIADYVRAQILDVLGLDDAHPLETNRGFFDMGMDSLMALELKNRLEAALDRTITPSVIFEHPNISALAQHFAAEISGGTATPAPVEQAPTPEMAVRSAIDPALLSAIDDLTEEEAAAALRELLDNP